MSQYTIMVPEWTGPNSISANGYPIVKKFFDVRDHRIHIIVRRPFLNDYVIGIGYDINNGSWGQGRYDFTTVEDAIAYLKEDYNVIEF